jgi:hypothetical protein
MDVATQQILLLVLGICSPFILSFLIVAILSPRFKAFAERHGWTVEPHPVDHRDYLFKGEQKSVPWEMEYYIYDHYRKLPVRHTPFIQVIVWTTKTIPLPHNTLLIYPRRDQLKHLAHPRLTVENDDDDRTNLITETENTNVLFDLPEKAVGVDEFRRLFVVRTDLEILPHNLVSALQLELLSWAKIQLVGPIILTNRNGVTIWWIPIGMRNEWLEKTVQLGMTLVSSF